MPSLTAVNRPSALFDVLRPLLESAAGGPLPQWQQAVVPALQVRTVEAGGSVFLQDVHHPYAYGVRSGLVKLCYYSDDGNEWIKSFAEEGRFFASIAALQPQGRTSFMVTAVEPCVLEQVDYRVLSALAAQHLPWARALHALTMVFAARKEQRERELLTLAPLERYVAFRDAYPALERRIPQKDLARHLGLTPVGLNRIVARVRQAEAST
ncbi:Crp/Fnr family transcriptional regulator [Curvibacter sp. APW13]|uniref:Crp/Fnr family transcriptional regulator n=1 Tax=Curvibacter sp. APW13 TaxID=3077236 RepID=UPI0028DF5898|nr:Crp/Fnr family transcriptional regulator [Curvibacter sp. APW13]MDT8991963.1 Crp/Fnr family transcriptional regulator [Curvibacter sp. APW13]